MRSDSPDKAVTVACPLCGAKPGDKCVDIKSGRSFGWIVHRERVRAWEASRGV